MSSISKRGPAGGSPGKRSSTDNFNNHGVGTKSAPQQKLSVIRKVDPPSPHLTGEEPEPMNTHMGQQKRVPGHLMAVTCLSYHPQRDIVATGSDDTTWKLWSLQ